MTEAVADVVRARRFEIVDSEGNVCATLGQSEEKMPELSLYDGEGHERATFTIDRAGALHVTMRTKTGGVFASLGFGSEWRPGLQLIDGHHQVIWSAVEHRF